MAKVSQYQAERIRDPQTGKRIANPLWNKQTADPRVWNAKHPEDPIMIASDEKSEKSSPTAAAPIDQLNSVPTAAAATNEKSSSSSPTGDANSEKSSPTGEPKAPERKRRDLNREKSPSSRKSSGATAADVRAGEKDYKQFFEDGLPVFTWLAGMLLGIFLLGSAELGQDIFAMTGEEADALAGPLASLLNKQKIPARVKKVIISSNDGIAIVAALGVYGQRVWTQLNSEEVRTYVTARNIAKKQGQARTAGRPGPGVTSGPVARPDANISNGHRAVPDTFGGFVGVGNYNN